MSKFMDRLIGQAKDELWEPGERPEEHVDPTATAVVTSDRFDKMSYDDIMRQAPALSLERMNMSLDYETGAEAYEDLFYLLYQSDPRIVDSKVMAPEFLGNHLILSAMRYADLFELYRCDSAQDMYSTAYTMLELTDPLREALDALKNAQEAQQALSEALAAAEQAASPQPPQEGEEEAQAQAEEDAEENLQQAIANAQQANRDLEATGKDLAKRANKAKDELEEEAEAAQMFGLGPGDLDRMSYEERRALAEKLHRTRAARLAKIVGAFRHFGEAERRRKIQHAPSEIHDYVMGNDLNRLSSEELHHLAIPELEDQFWLRWAQHGLLVKDVRGVEKAGHGPIVVVCDESYSMDTELDSAGNTREAWSKAVALSLSDQARRAGRDFTYIGFGGRGEVYVHNFPKGQGPVDNVIDFVSHFFKGGTSFTEPLAKALEVIETAGKNAERRPDVVFITDGNGAIDNDFRDHWHKRLEVLDARCYGIQVGTEGASIIKTIAHKTMQIDKLTATPEGMRDLFRQI